MYLENIKEKVIEKITKEHLIEEGNISISELWLNIINLSTDIALECIKEYEKESQKELTMRLRQKGITL
jgi:hypothetical protein